MRARIAGDRASALAELALMLPVQIIDPEIHHLIEEGPEPAPAVSGLGSVPRGTTLRRALAALSAGTQDSATRPSNPGRTWAS